MRKPSHHSILCAAAFVLVGLAAGCGAVKRAPKNVLLITIDTLRADRIGAYGDPSTRTPSIDDLARRGTLFESAHSPIPLTLPSHTSIMTGQYPRTHLVLSHAYTLAPERVTLAEIFKEHGYSTAAFVSSHVLDKSYGLDQGFETYWERWHLLGDVTEALTASGFELTAKAARLWIKARPAEKPFFAWVHLFQPHKPYSPPAPLAKLYDPGYGGSVVADVPTLVGIWEEKRALAPEDLAHIQALYQGEVTTADREVGRIIDLLEREGLMKDTIVIVTSDHGEVLYEHDCYFGHDIMLYEPAIAVPLVFYGDGLFPAGAIARQNARLIDLAPTILESAGLSHEFLGATDGLSLLPPVWREGKGAERRWGPKQLAGRPDMRASDTLFAEIFPPKPGWKVEPRHALRTPEWKLMMEDGVEARELYNLGPDPRERANLALAEPGAGARLFAVWDAWRATKEDHFKMTFPEIDAETEENLRSLGYIDN